MKTITLSIICTISLAIANLGLNAQQVWFEDFDTEANGSVTGTASGPIATSWSTTAPAGGNASFCKQTHVYSYEVFQINQTGAGSEGVWNSGSINISALGDVALEINLYSAGANPTDYVRAYYKVDGGPEVMFGELLGAPLEMAFPASAIVSGNTLQIIVRGMENTPGNFYLYGNNTGFPNAVGFENVSVIDIKTLYSRQTGTWDVAGTWSNTVGGPSCGCIPDSNSHVVINSNHTVSIDSESDAINVNVKSAGILRWTAGYPLNIKKGGTITVDAGGSMNFSGQANAKIDYDYPYNNSIISNGTFAMGAIDINRAANITLGGTGSFLVNGNITIPTSATVTNNRTVATTVNGQLVFEGDNSRFTNNGAFTTPTTTFNGLSSIINNNGTFASAIVVAANTDNNNTVNNNAGGTFNLSTINANDGNLLISNAGTITQTGNVTNIDNGSDFTNQSTGTWNWNYVFGTAPDVDLAAVLNLGTAGNTFNYNAAGNQTIQNTTYYNLGITSSGTKTSSANLDINGNLLIAGTAKLDVNAGSDNINIAGNWTVTSTNSDPFVQGNMLVTFDGATTQTISSAETFANLTINNTSATSPQIVLNNAISATGTLTMTRGNINLNGNRLTLGTSATATGTLVHGGTSASGWMYNGEFRRYVAAGAIANGSVAGLFPLGNATNFRPFSLSTSANMTTGGYFNIDHSLATNAITLAPAIADAGPVASITRQHQAYWRVQSNGVIGGTFNIVTGGTGFGQIGSLADLRISKTSSVVGAHAAATGTVADPRLQRTGISLLNLTTTGGNQFYVSSTNAVNSTLPVKLGSFDAHLKGSEVVLSWTTLQEINNDYFTIQRTTDFHNYEDVAKIAGHGTTSSAIAYQYTDASPVSGKSYYRLKQTDLDGNSTYSEVVMITTETAAAAASLKLYPNPGNGRQVTLELKGAKAGSSIPVLVYNHRGNLVQSLQLSQNSDGTATQVVNFTNSLAPGIYIIKVGTAMTSAKMIVQ